MAATSSLVTAPTEEPVERTVAVAVPIDLRLTLAPLVRGRGDPTTRFLRGTFQRASRTPEGPAAEVISLTPEGIRVQAWGPGAGWLVAAMPDLVGVDDDPSVLVPHQPLVAEISRRLAGLRLGRTGAILEALVPAVLEQKVTGAQAQRGFAGLVRALGEPAPGPLGLRLPPAPSALATLPYYGYHPFGIERRRADTVRRVAREAGRLEALARLPASAVQAALMALPGIGPWSAAEVAARALGDPDAVSVGDFHLAHLVCWALAGEPRGTDERMLDLLEPYRGQRGRVIRLLEASGIRAPAYGPRLAVRRIERD
jgi:3-methyladenine DNA glycosylase/8-oxoguanine DNA glycosylase